MKKPKPIPATRCRHWDKKCQKLKDEKVSGLFNQNDNRLRGLIAAASGKSFGKAFDWRWRFLVRFSGENVEWTSVRSPAGADRKSLHSQGKACEQWQENQ
ncbi:MAG: hypothetical protein ABI977_03500 [Acidobacteriota bacterium]